MSPRTAISPSSAMRTVTPGSGRPDGADPDVPLEVDRDRRARSRSARSPRRWSPRCRGRSGRAGRRAARRRRSRAVQRAAEGGPQLAVDQPVEDGVLGLEQHSRARRASAAPRCTRSRPARPGRRSRPCRRPGPAAWPSCRPSRTPGAPTARTSAGTCRRSATRFLMSAVCPVRTRACTTPTWISRAKLCASGRNSRVDEPSWNRFGQPRAGRCRCRRRCCGGSACSPWAGRWYRRCR